MGRIVRVVTAAVTSVLILVSCGQPREQGGAQQTAPPASVEAISSAGKAMLAQNMPLQGGEWQNVEGVRLAPGEGASPVQGQRPVVLSGVETSGFHRVAAKYSFGAPQAMQVTIWVKATEASPFINVEAAGARVNTPELFQNYGIALIDLSNGSVVAGPRDDPAKALSNLTVTTEGEWKRISFDFTTNDGNCWINVGLNRQGQRQFAGSPEHQVSIGGFRITPTG